MCSTIDPSVNVLFNSTPKENFSAIEKHNQEIRAYFDSINKAYCMK